MDTLKCEKNKDTGRGWPVVVALAGCNAYLLVCVTLLVLAAAVALPVVRVPGW
jgi:hypothetical protein